jgi:hypothetical protein
MSEANAIRNHPRIIAERDHSRAQELCRQPERDLPKLRFETFVATWEQRPYDRNRTDEPYVKWNTSIYNDAAVDGYLPDFLRATTPEEIQAASAAMSTGLTAIYYKAHAFGGVMHINSPQEEISVWIRSLTAKCWRAPEQEVLALFLHPGEHLIAEGITFEGVTTERGRVLLRADLPALTGKRVEDFTSEDVIEEARMSEARDAEAARHQPWESNHYVTRNGRHIRLDDIEGRDN